MERKGACDGRAAGDGIQHHLKAKGGKVMSEQVADIIGCKRSLLKSRRLTDEVKDG